MKYRPGVFSELSIQTGMKKWIEERRNICEDPRIYDELPQEIKLTLDTWISNHIAPRKKTNMKRSSYGLKTDFQRETGIYIYTGVFNGAMLKAGYQPVNPEDTNGHFRMNLLSSP